MRASRDFCVARSNQNRQSVGVAARCSASGINGLAPSVKPWAVQVANGATEKGCPLWTALPELIGLKGPGGVLLAEITPAQHMKTQTFLKSQNLIRHWITSFAFVEHGVSLRPFWGSVQSRKFVVAGSTMGEVSLASAHTKSAFLRA